MNQSAVFSFYRSDDSDTTYHVDIYDGESGTDRTLVKRFTYESDVEADDGELLVIGDYVYISPHNKFLALVDGVWYLNDYVSTTPRFNFSQDTSYTTNSEDAVFEGLPETGFIALTTLNPNTVYTGSVLIYIGSANLTVNYSGTPREIIDEIVTEITPVLGSDFTVTVSESNFQNFTFVYTINIQRNVVGDFGSVLIEAFSNQGGIAFTFANVAGGVEPRFSGSLQQSNDYAYTVRYRYADGHVTKTAYPKFVKTTNQQTFVGLDIEIVPDIQGGNATIEIFRRTGSESFFLIRRLRNPQPSVGANIIRFVDTGEPELSVLDQKSYTWTKKHKTHVGARDRYVRANVKYENRDHTATGIATVNDGAENNSEALPYNTKLKIYTRARFADGLESFHKPFGNVAVTNKKDQQLLITTNNIEPDVKELAFYGQYQQTQSVERIPFVTNLISNTKIPTLKTRDNSEDEQDRPVTPRVFFGYRYIAKRVNLPGAVLVGSTPNRYVTNSAGEEVILRTLINGQTIDDTIPDKLYVELGRTNPRVSTTPLDGFFAYNKRIESINSAVISEQSVVYELEGYDALLEAANRGLLKLRSNPTNFKFETINSQLDGTIRPPNVLNVQLTNRNYSNDLSDVEFNDTLIDVLGLLVDNETEIVTGTNNTVDLNDACELYLQLDPESVYSQFDNDGKNVVDFRSLAFPFYLLGVDYVEYSDDVTTNIEVFSHTSKSEDTILKRVYDYDTGFVSTNSVPQIQELIYLGTSDGGSQISRTGFIQRRTNDLTYYELAPYNIFETLVEEESLGLLRSNFPNQLVWSETILEGTNISGARNIPPQNFIDISSEHGEIIKIIYVGSSLLVFCRNGVAVVAIGEVITQNTGGNLRVDATRFLNSEVWILKGVTNISKKSIKQYENVIFFADEKDVWMYDGQLSNISDGAIHVSPNSVGGIDPKNREYHLTTESGTWAYAWEVKEWAGAHDYKLQSSLSMNNRYITVINNTLSEMNTGNLMNNLPYETVVESVSEDLQDPSTDKLYRKFYVQTDGDAEFSYSKDDKTYVGRKLSEYRQTGDTKQVGITNLGAAKRLYWKLKTTTQDFVLKLIAFEYTPRNRR
jgi:hypothetical protein